MFKKHSLPDLPYDFGALEPVISGKIMELHHGKHHQAYVNNLNAAMEKFADAEAKGDVAAQCALLQAIKFNGGGHVNHSIFWTNLAPVNKGGGTPPSGALNKAIDETFGPYEKFVELFSAEAAGVQGSGWAWLGFCPKMKRLALKTCANQDPLSTTGLVPLLGIDVWEHAYYLDYENRRPDYLKNIWKVVNWKKVEERYESAISSSK